MLDSPKQAIFAVNNLCEKRSKAFEGSVSKATKTRPWSTLSSTFQEELLGSAEHCDLT